MDDLANHHTNNEIGIHPMNRPFGVAIDTLRWLLLLIFGILVCFWCLVLINSVDEFIRGGPQSVQQWFFKVALKPEEILAQRSPHWDLVELRFGGLAVLTIMPWLANRRMVKRLASQLRS